MTRDIRATRDALNLTTAALARLVGVTDRTAYRWMAGALPVPEPVWRYLELRHLVLHPTLAMLEEGRWHVGVEQQALDCWNAMACVALGLPQIETRAPYPAT